MTSDNSVPALEWPIMRAWLRCDCTHRDPETCAGNNPDGAPCPDDRCDCHRPRTMAEYTDIRWFLAERRLSNHDPLYGPTVHGTDRDGNYIGPYRSLDEMPAPAPLPAARCGCGRRLDDAGACRGCNIIGNCQCDDNGEAP